MTRTKISIIVPVYNTEKYLRRCIDSILSQSFTDFELLLIDDGSKDSSGAICDEYAVKDNRIKVFHKENGGVSSARNLGIDEAKGEWLYFVDADDEVLPGGLKNLVTGVNDDVCMVMGGYEIYDENDVLQFRSSIKIDVTGYMSNINALCSLYNAVPYQCYNGYLWNRILRSSIIKEQHLRFDNSIQIKEDTLFLVQFLCISKMENVWYTLMPIYKYRWSETSVMKTLWTQWNSKYISSFDACEKMLNTIYAANIDDKYLIDLAKTALYDRYYMIKRYLIQYNVVNYNLLKDLRKRLVEDIGYCYIYKIHILRFIRRCIRYMQRHILKTIK